MLLEQPVHHRLLGLAPRQHDIHPSQVAEDALDRLRGYRDLPQLLRALRPEQALADDRKVA